MTNKGHISKATTAMLVRLTTAVLILLGIGPMAHAQEAWVSATVAQSTHALFSSPAGVAGGVTLPLRGPVAFRAAYNLLDDTYSRFARACAGLIREPPACPEERIDDATSLRAVTLALVVDVKRRGGATLALMPTMTVATIRSVGRGRETGNSVRSSELVLGLGGGAELSYQPDPTWPVSFHTGAHISWAGPVYDPPVDGYAPFDEGMRLTRLDLGVSIGRRPRP